MIFVNKDEIMADCDNADSYVKDCLNEMAEDNMGIQSTFVALLTAAHVMEEQLRRTLRTNDRGPSLLNQGSIDQYVDNVKALALMRATKAFKEIWGGLE